LLANDGLGAGHVTRALAIARALRRKTDLLELLLATTSEADAVLRVEPIAAVRWPGPWMARRSGWPDTVRSDVGTRVVRAAIEAFRPNLLVTDTFPWGPHGELSGLVRGIARRALIRRSVRADRARAGAAGEGLSDYNLAIVPDDPRPHQVEDLPIPVVRVPPITLFEADDAIPRDAARDRLGLPREGRLILVASGGGGDEEAVEQGLRAATALARMHGAPSPVLAVGPLARQRPALAGVRCIAETPLQPLLAAFDGAIAPAGYNLAHELAKAGVPMALFAMPRAFDDQAGRAARFEEAGLGRSLGRVNGESLASAVEWMESAPRPTLIPCGADRAAEALLHLLDRDAP
jgi:predicted glycosyltransferase